VKLRSARSLSHLLCVSSLLCCGSKIAVASAPSVVVDAQNILASGFSYPEGIAISTQGTIYVADTNNNRVVTVSASGAIIPVGLNGYTLNGPSGVAVDSNGNLYIADSNNARVLEVSENVTSVVASAPILGFPIAVAVDSNNSLYIGDGNNSAVYKVTSGGSPVKVTIGNISNLFPQALLADTSGNLYIADGNSSNIYKLPSGSSTAQNINPNGLTLNSPSGLAFDTAGDLFVLDGFNLRVIEVPQGDPTEPYMVPITGLNTATALASDPSGNLYVTDVGNNSVTQLIYSGNAINLGTVATGSTGPAVAVNYELNAAETLNAFKITMQGDTKPEATIGAGTTCQFQSYADSPSGSSNPISPANPFVCTANVQGAPAYPGARRGALQLLGSSNSILASTPITEIGSAAAAEIFPGVTGVAVSGFNTPEAVAVSSQNGTVYIANSGAGTVDAWKGLTGSNTLTQVNTAPNTLSSPSAVALNGEGDLFIADETLGEVIVVPAAAGSPSYVLATGQFLKHPITLAFDAAGNLYIGDAGSADPNGSNTNPGFIVKVPPGGLPASIVNTSPITIVFPQALVTDASGNLYVADGGAASGGTPQLVLVPQTGAAASVVNVAVSDPVGLAMDSAGQLYILDASYLSQLTILPPDADSYVVPLAANALQNPSSIAFTAGGNNLLVTDIQANDLVELSTSQAQLTFPSTAVTSPVTVTPSQSATIVSAGNLTLKPSNAGAAYTETGNFSEFEVQSTAICSGITQLVPAQSCSLPASFAPAYQGAQDLLLTSIFNSLSQVQLLLTGTTPNASTATASPTFSPGSATFSTAQTVTLSDSTAGAVIYYTTDGTAPTTASDVYSFPIAVNGNATLQAVAVAPGYSQSPAASATYVIQSGPTSTINFAGGFPNAGGLQLNGVAKVNSGKLELTDGGGYEAGSAFWTTPVNIQSFSTNFTFQLTSAVADGFTFTIQNAGTTALGTYGGGLGYGINPNGGTGSGIGNSVAIKFDIYSNSGEGSDSTGIFTDGASPTNPAVNLTSSGIVLSSGDTISAQLVYNGTTLTLSLTDTVTNKTFTHAFTINIPSTVGGNTAYVGFTGGTGGSTAIQNIKTWTFTSGTPQVNFAGGFPGATGLQLNSATKVNTGNLELTDGGDYEAGSAFWTTPVNIQSFITNFTFQLTSAVADGFTFTIQNTGDTALGSYGGGLGYGINPNGGTSGGIGESVAIKFDIYSNSGEGSDSTGIFTDGASPTNPAVDLTSSGIALSSGDTISAQLIYDGTTLTLTLTDTATNNIFTHAFTINIPSAVGGNTAYVGFTGGTGGSTAIQNIKTWTFTAGTT
jgi:sugar lactone lactonase YvrE/ribonuclease HI